MCYLAGAFLHSCLLEPTYVVARYDLAAWPSIFWAIVLLVDCATTGMRSHRARVFSRTAIVAALCLCSSAVTLGVHLVPVPNRHLRLARMIARTVGQNDLVISVAKYELFMLHEWHRLGFSAEVISFPPQHDRQLCWYDSLAELSNLEEIERGVETVTQRIERAFLEGCRVWLVATGKTEGPRWEVDRRLFQRLQELEIDVQPVDDDSGLAELRRLSNHPAGSTSN